MYLMPINCLSSAHPAYPTFLLMAFLHLSPSSKTFAFPLFPILTSFTKLLIFSILHLSLVFASDDNSNAPSSTHKSCFPAHYATLLQLKQGFRFLSSSSANLSSWDHSNADCCTWEGITCDAANSHVIGLDLSGRNIQGYIAFESIFRVGSLKKFSLADNAFDSAPFPSGLSQLSSLTHLNLSHLKLHGQIPLDVSRLTSLVSLDLSYNGYDAWSLRLENTGIGALVQNLSSLRELHLDWVDISAKGGDWGLAISSSLPSLRKLSLSRCSLSGALPSSLVNLSNLQHLDLSSNHFRGPIPYSYGSKLLKLEKIILSHNLLTGSIPPFLFSHPALQVLDVSANQLSGPLEELKNASASLLREINLGENKLQGTIPSSIFGLANLETLRLPSNNFSGVVELRFFQNLKKLSHLDLSDNSLSTDFGNGNSTSLYFPQMQILRLRSCNISEFPSFMKTQERLHFIDLSNNSITGEIPGWIWNVGNGALNYLNLSHNALRGIVSSSSLLLLSEWVVVDLSSNLLRGPVPMPPPSSIYFSLSENSFSGEIPRAFCSASSLQFLDLSGNQLSGPIPQCLGEVSPTLRVLNLQANSLSGPLLRNFKERCGLQILDLSQNRLEGQVPFSLTNCQMLEMLDLGHNQINGTFPSWIEDLSELRILILRNNEFHGPIANVLADQSFPRMQIFDVSGNHFTGSLPPSLFLSWKPMMEEPELAGSIRSELLLLDSHHIQVLKITIGGQIGVTVILLTVIDLSNNCFEGDIPDTLGILRSLAVLNLSHNSFTGQIPKSFGKLMNLESLDLSDNKILGDIPWQLTHLYFLEVLNLSQNRLVGRIPQEKQFLTFTSESYLGNSGLCGPPVTTVCPAAPILTSKTSAVLLDWDVVVMGFGAGYTAGLGVLFSLLAIWSDGRKVYSKCLDRMLLRILPSKLLPPKRPSKHRNGGRIQANGGRRK